MRIGIDAREICRPNTGIGKYVSNLVRCLALIDNENQYVLFVESDRFPLPFSLPANFQLMQVWPRGHRNIQSQLALPLLQSRARVDLFHATHHDAAPLLGTAKMVLTVHDIAPIDLQDFPLLHRQCYALLSWGVTHRAAAVISVSQFTQKRLVAWNTAAKTKSTVVYEAADEYYPDEDPSKWERLGKRFGLRGRYVLYVGSLARRKNLKGLLRSIPTVKSLCSDIQFVVVGIASGRADYSLSADEEGQVIRIHGGLSVDEMRLLYACAEVMVFPSFYEGFGLPVLEAMACGCPVVTSRTSSLPEIVGAAGILIEPFDNDAISAAIVSVLNDPSLRKQMRNDGIARAAKFSWERMAQETLTVYRSAFASK